jgi:EmrB/QacA subfamily drug resistance transporter
MPRPHPLRSLLILSLAALAFALAQTMLIPALTELAKSLNTDASGVAWTVTAYLLAAAVCTPVFGRLGDMFGKRRLLVVALGIFVAGSILSALGTSLEVVVAGRVLQGAGGGIFPLCFGIIRDEFPREKVGSSIGLISATFGIGGGAGLILGGLITDHASYHWIFWLGAISAALAAVFIELFVPESPVRTPGRVDVRGAIVLGLGLTAPLLAIAKANEWGWGDTRTLGLFVVGAVILSFWVWLQRRTPEPLVDIEMLRQPTVAMTNFATVLVGFGMFGSFILIPQLAEAPKSSGYGFGLDATGAGLLMVPGALVMLVAGPLSGVLGTRFGSRVPLALGAIITSAGLLLMALVHDTQLEIIVWNLVMSTGIGLAFAAMPNLILEAVTPEETGQATGVNTLVRSVGASLGAQISAAVLAGSVVAGLPTDSGYDHRIPHPRAPRPDGRRTRPRMTAVAARTRADAVRNRERVIAAAAEVFREKGDAAVVPEIAARAGVGKGTVYRCFPTKDHLVAAVATQRVRWFEQETREAATSDDPWGAFMSFMERIADAYCEDRGMVASMSQAIELDELVAARADAHDALRELMDRAIAQGSMRADAQPADLKVLLSGIARSLAAEQERDPAVWRHYARLVVDALRA